MQTKSSQERIPYQARADKEEGTMSLGTVLVVLVILLLLGRI